VQLHTYLVFNGDCETAFKFYEECLGGRIESMRSHANAGDVPGERRDKILHASMILGDQVLLGADASPGAYEKPQGFFLHLQMKDPAEADRIFHALADGGLVKMPMQQTFWARSFGMVVDRFGTPWMVQCERVEEPV
jgi:PhnB protein